MFSGPQVSNIGLGSLKAFTSEDCEINEELVTLGNCWNWPEYDGSISPYYSTTLTTPPPAWHQFQQFVPSAFENGINLFDISEPFTSKRAEVELGRIIKKNGWARRQFVVSTKVYWDKWDKDNKGRRGHNRKTKKIGIFIFGLSPQELSLKIMGDPPKIITNVKSIHTFLVFQIETFPLLRNNI